MAEANWNEVFKNYKKTTFEEITNYISEENPEYEKQIKESIDAGKSFLVIKRDFYQKYFKQYLPIAKPKKATMKDWANKH